MAVVSTAVRRDRRWWQAGALLVWLLIDLGLGIWEMGGWKGFAPALKPPAVGGWGQPAADLVTWINAFGMLTGMAWPLLFAGLSMGTLVFLRWRKERTRYLRIRLGLAVLAYFGLTAAIPFVGSSFPVVPNPGGTGLPTWNWPTGLSMLGFVLLALLFGRGSYCGVICPAATYWGGLGQHFIPANINTPRARRLAAGLRALMVGLFVLTALLSIADTLLHWHVSVYGTDPAVFFSGVTWMVIWFLMLLVVPFLGNRAFTRFLCPMGATMGWVAQHGVWEIQAIDPAVCASCTDQACTRSCEVSLPVGRHLAEAGRYRSAACVGCGNCQAACPSQNIHYRTALDWVLPRSTRQPAPVAPGLPQ
ncbi:MAG: 4Fe-4S binding protein [Firmicutes bacterium]|nr:4Fe-4S binding protein [Bacillota bacterium]